VFSQCGSRVTGLRHNKKGDTFSRAVFARSYRDSVVVRKGLRAGQGCRVKTLHDQRQSDAKSRIESLCVTTENTYDCIPTIFKQGPSQDRPLAVNDWGGAVWARFSVRSLEWKGAALGALAGAGTGRSSGLQGKNAIYLPAEPGLISDSSTSHVVPSSTPQRAFSSVKTFRRTRFSTDTTRS